MILGPWRKWVYLKKKYSKNTKKYSLFKKKKIILYLVNNLFQTQGVRLKEQLEFNNYIPE